MHRTVLIDDDEIVAKRDDHKKVARKRKVPQRARRTKNGRGNPEWDRGLCEHPGPCKPGYGCKCCDAGTYCDRNCGCLSDCESSLSLSFTVVELSYWEVPTGGLVADVTSSEKVDIFAMMSVHVSTVARNAIPSFASRVTSGQQSC